MEKTKKTGKSLYLCSFFLATLVKCIHFFPPTQATPAPHSSLPTPSQRSPLRRHVEGTSQSAFEMRKQLGLAFHLAPIQGEAGEFRLYIIITIYSNNNIGNKKKNSNYSCNYNYNYSYNSCYYYDTIIIVEILTIVTMTIITDQKKTQT